MPAKDKKALEDERDSLSRDLSIKVGERFVSFNMPKTSSSHSAFSSCGIQLFGVGAACFAFIQDNCHSSCCDCFQEREYEEMKGTLSLLCFLKGPFRGPIEEALTFFLFLSSSS